MAENSQDHKGGSAEYVSRQDPLSLFAKAKTVAARLLTGNVGDSDGLTLMKNDGKDELAVVDLVPAVKQQLPQGDPLRIRVSRCEKDDSRLSGECNVVLVKFGFLVKENFRLIHQSPQGDVILPVLMRKR